MPSSTMTVSDGLCARRPRDKGLTQEEEEKHIYFFARIRSDI